MNSGKTQTKDQQRLGARERGQAMRRAIHAARAQAGIDSDTELSQRSKVHYDTLMNWFSGATVPRPAAVRKVADVLGVPYGDLLAAYDGRDPDPVALDVAVRDLVSQLSAFLEAERRSRAEQNQAIATLLRAMAADILAPRGSSPSSVPTMDVPAGESPLGRVGNGSGHR